MNYIKEIQKLRKAVYFLVIDVDTKREQQRFSLRIYANVWLKTDIK